jgi:hypothetical protein
MNDFNSTLELLRQDFVALAQLEKLRHDFNNSPVGVAEKDERDKQFKKTIDDYRAGMERVLKKMLEYPPYLLRHDPYLAEFHNVAPFDKSVFIMTKYPDDPNSNAQIDLELKAVIQAVCQAVEVCGYKARLATDKHYHGQLWDNVELYLLGCSRGIAIVEDKYKPELNPNIAMEWGWMRGTDRKVFYLVEKDFRKARADWSGLIEQKFDWADPGRDIAAPIRAWLTA